MGLSKFNIDDQKIVTGLDIGSDSVKCVMAVFKEDQFEIIGTSKVAHKGFDNQQLIDAKNITLAISHACQEVEILAERPITDLWVSLGSAFSLLQSEGMSIIHGGKVSRKNIIQAIEVARAIPLPDHQEVVHILPTYFKVDKKEPVFNPVGLSGMRLETSVLLVTSELAGIQDLRKCIKNAGKVCRGFVIQPLASSLPVSTAEDRHKGLCVIDMGRNSSQISVFLKGRIIYMSQIPFGGDDLTGELVANLKVSPNIAEGLKISYGIPSKENLSETVEMKDEHFVPVQQIYETLTQCLDTTFAGLRETLNSQGLTEQISNGIIFTGGGSQLKNLNSWARDYFSKPVRIGNILNVSNSFSSQLEYGTAIGLLHYAEDSRLDFKERSVNLRSLNIKHWIKELIL